jgi:signal transduction histidine kinase
MQPTAQTTGIKGSGRAASGLTDAAVAGTGLAGATLAITERQRVEAVVETLANLRGKGDSLAEVAHEARNMVTALWLYSELLEEPGVLNSPFLHYAHELRLVATASRSLVEKLVSLDLRSGLTAVLARSTATHPNPSPDPFAAPSADTMADPYPGSLRNELQPAGWERAHRWEVLPAAPLANLAAELTANRNLLSALAGSAIALTLEIEGGALPVRMSGEDLTRILVNLVKNAAEAMPDGGRIQLGLRQRPNTGSSLSDGRGRAAPEALTLTVEDNGPGIPTKTLEEIFDSGYTTRAAGSFQRDRWPASHRGLGLSITRSIVEAAGGCIHAANCDPAGARFEIELPIRTR